MMKDNFQYPMLKPERKCRRRLMRLLFAVAAALLSGIAGGAAIAYLSVQTEEYVSTVMPDSVSFQDWKDSRIPALVWNFYPEAESSRDSAITDTGENRAWVFPGAKAPVRNPAVVNPEKKRADTALLRLSYPG